MIDSQNTDGFRRDRTQLTTCPSQLEGGLLLVGVVTYDSLLDKYALIVTDQRERDADLTFSDDALDETERRLLRMVAQGSVSKQIARSLETSPATAGRRVRQALKKLGKRSRAAAVAHASKVGLLEPVA
jgi:DNA-binding NarL/FixJ family response regulator